MSNTPPPPLVMSPVPEVQDTSPADSAHEDSGNANGRQPLPVDELVRRIGSGEVACGSVSTEDRQRCVDYLTLEGFEPGQIAQLLGVTERTVYRDRAALRRAYALRPDRLLGDELLGEFERFTQAAKQQLVRLSRDPDTPPYCRLWATEAAVRVQQRLIDTAYRLKYLETGHHRLERERANDREEIQREHEQFRAELDEAFREAFYKGCDEEKDAYPVAGYQVEGD